MIIVERSVRDNNYYVLSGTITKGQRCSRNDRASEPVQGEGHGEGHGEGQGGASPLG